MTKSLISEQGKQETLMNSLLGQCTAYDGWKKDPEEILHCLSTEDAIKKNPNFAFSFYYTWCTLIYKKNEKETKNSEPIAVLKREAKNDFGKTAQKVGCELIGKTLGFTPSTFYSNAKGRLKDAYLNFMNKGSEFMSKGAEIGTAIWGECTAYNGYKKEPEAVKDCLTEDALKMNPHFSTSFYYTWCTNGAYKAKTADGLNLQEKTCKQLETIYGYTKGNFYSKAAGDIAKYLGPILAVGRFITGF